MRIDPDCIGVFYMKKNLRASRLYYVKSQIWLGRPNVQYDISGPPRPPLATLSMLFLAMCMIYFETLPVGKSGNQKLCTVHLYKLKILVQMSISLFFLTYGKSPR